jgi:zinc finger protein
MAEMRIDCPVCGRKNGAISKIDTSKIPYFGEVVESSIRCEYCGFKHSDVMSVEKNDPAKHILKISKDNLDSRVVRSQTSTVSIPEAGIKVEPGPKSQGYVSNVEGVITRFISATNRAKALYSDEESIKNIETTQNFLSNILDGEVEATLIIQDPYGQSKIADLKAESIPLTEEELENLTTGYTILEKDEIDKEN